ncbi:tyrosine-type recombinase/integrase [Tissierella sp.]|uniref:tyrosine-type recombinase/integrase n=1 Tax=Tissierella sp. TaxID=41274 RepID=UPI0028AA3A09|nr:tyrosine-type recombinase/integrase [Tissierella sp.]
MLLEDVLKEFIYDCETRSLSPRTIKGYRNNNLRFFKFLKDELDITELEKVNSKQIKMYLSLLREQKLTETYANSILKNVRSFFNYCVDEEYITDNPAKKVSWVKEPKVLINAFTDDEVVKMLNIRPTTTYLTARDKCILAMFLDTGIRNLELCSISDYDIKGRYILIRGKGNKERQVPVTPFLKKYMIKYERMKEGYFKYKFNVEDYYFLSRTGRQLTVEATLNIMKKIGKESGVDREGLRVSPHTCRHYYAQSQLKNGLDVYSLSRLLGHEDITITKRYLQSIKDDEILDIAISSSPLMNLRGVRG